MNDELIRFMQEIRQFQGEIRKGQENLEIGLAYISSKLDTHLDSDAAHGSAARWNMVSRFAALAALILSVTGLFRP